jgi:hypothetical protein
MSWKWNIGVGMALRLGGGTALLAQGQVQIVPMPSEPSAANVRIILQGQPGAPAKAMEAVIVKDQPTDPTGCCNSSCGGGCDSCCGDGPTLPQDVKCLQGLIGDNVCSKCGGPGLKVYGWLDAGYTYASTGPGPLTVETRENRFGNEFLFNEIALVVEKPLDPNDW